MDMRYTGSSITRRMNRLFRGCPKAFRPGTGRIVGEGIESTGDIRCGRFLEFKRGDEAQDVVPEPNDVILIDVALRFDLPARAIDGVVVPLRVERFHSFQVGYPFPQPVEMCRNS
jgi:hypothetical protein